MDVYKIEKQWAQFKGFSYWVKHRFIIASLCCFSIGIIINILIGMLQTVGVYSFNQLHPILLVFWVLPAYTYLYLQASFLRSIKKFAFSATSQILFPIFTLLFLYVGEIFVTEYQGFEVVITIGIACVMSVLVQQINVIRFYPKNIFSIKPDYSNANIWRSASKEMMFASFLVSNILAINIVMLKLIGLRKEEVGLFGAITVIASVLFIVNTASKRILGPFIRPAVSLKKLDELQKVMRLNVWFSFFLGVMVIVPIILFGKAILAAFGKEYVVAYVPLIIVLVSYLVMICFGMAPTLLLYSGNRFAIIMIMIIQLAIILTLDISLIPSMGLYGAIIALVIGGGFSSVSSAYLVKKKLGIKTFLFI